MAKSIMSEIHTYGTGDSWFESCRATYCGGATSTLKCLRPLLLIFLNLA